MRFLKRNWRATALLVVLLFTGMILWSSYSDVLSRRAVEQAVRVQILKSRIAGDGTSIEVEVSFDSFRCFWLWPFCPSAVEVNTNDLPWVTINRKNIWIESGGKQYFTENRVMYANFETFPFELQDGGSKSGYICLSANWPEFDKLQAGDPPKFGCEMYVSWSNGQAKGIVLVTIGEFLGKLNRSLGGFLVDVGKDSQSQFPSVYIHPNAMEIPRPTKD